MLPDGGHDIDHLGAVDQHLLEMRYQPAFVPGMPEEAAADMIIKPAEQNMVEGGEEKLGVLRNAGAQIGTPELFELCGLRKFLAPQLATEEDVVILRQTDRCFIEQNRLRGRA